MHSDSRSERTAKMGFFGWCKRHPIVVVVLAVFCLLIGTCILLDARADQQVERVLREIRDSGAPISIEDLNAMAPSIPDEENMALLVLRHGEGIAGVEIPPDKDKLLPFVGAGRPLPTGQRMSPEALEAAQWYLDACVVDLAGVYEALKLERGCFPVVWASQPVDNDWSGLSEYRTLAKTIALNAIVTAETGNASDAVRSVQALLDLDRALHCNKSLVDLLVRMAIRQLAVNSMERTINLCGLDAETLASLQSELARLPGTFDFRAALEIERVVALDMVQFSMSGNASGGAGILAYVPMLEPVSTIKGLKVFTLMVDAIDKPDIHSLKRCETAEGLAASLPQYCFVWKMMMPSCGRACQLWIRAFANNVTMQAALACERFRLATGDWPTTLDQLVPAYLEAVPIDPFAEVPIHYARIDEGIRIWSIGEDLIDDGGDVKRLVVQSPNNRPTDTGWVLLNPDLRGRAADSGGDRSEEGEH